MVLHKDQKGIGMRLNRIIAALLMAGTAVPAVSQSDSVAGDSLVSKVAAVYVRESRGLYIEKKLLRTSGTKELWVHVRLATALPGEAAGELFQVPPEITIEVGDLVTTRSGDPTPRQMNLLPEVNRVTRVVAGHDSLMAIAFGITNSKLPQSRFSAALAYSNPAPAQFEYAGTRAVSSP
jgi:hypothetical protein